MLWELERLKLSFGEHGLSLRSKSTQLFQYLLTVYHNDLTFAELWKWIALTAWYSARLKSCISRQACAMLLFRCGLFGSSSKPEINFLYFNTALHSKCFAYEVDTKYGYTHLHRFPSRNYFCWVWLQVPYFRKQNIFLYICISY